MYNVVQALWMVREQAIFKVGCLSLPVISLTSSTTEYLLVSCSGSDDGVSATAVSLVNALIPVGLWQGTLTIQPFNQTACPTHYDSVHYPQQLANTTKWWEVWKYVIVPLKECVKCCNELSEPSSVTSVCLSSTCNATLLHQSSNKPILMTAIMLLSHTGTD
ncbi:hypothetical protein BDW22DRAFT_1345821 [Trametopsis cervina]|nr:hypothetical protein BDW22DRAFT_1345821 [Trametopsis cervina]